ncbi:gas vesicle protein GvpQ [Halobacillus trueperi]|uniref:Gas vesicle protein GvpQ n=1 Tax=Halobacillus trueperi TaxID=156205 RepID=A0A3E0JBB4_9BACI|nr:gas vesicle protein GvpQ [Halobacillus trueperi]REJ10238.1 gas vesicle protein GvpQ [Halobacillus trueperi]
MTHSQNDEEKKNTIVDQVEGGLKKSAHVIKDKMPNPVSKIIRKADDPQEATEHAKDEMSDQAGDFFRQQFEKQMQSKIEDMKEELQEKTSANADHVHSKAEEVKGKVQEHLLEFKDKLGSVKESGEQIQDSISENSSSSGRIKGANDIKGVSHIKSSASIKGPKDIKGLSSIKTYHS